MDQDRHDAPSLEDAETLGEALRAARLASGRSMAQLSTMTRVHSRYLTALEQNEFSVLPSRIVSLGYTRLSAPAGGVGPVKRMILSADLPAARRGMNVLLGSSAGSVRGEIESLARKLNIAV